MSTPRQKRRKTNWKKTNPPIRLTEECGPNNPASLAEAQVNGAVERALREVLNLQKK